MREGEEHLGGRGCGPRCLSGEDVDPSLHSQLAACLSRARARAHLEQRHALLPVHNGRLRADARRTRRVLCSHGSQLSGETLLQAVEDVGKRRVNDLEGLVAHVLVGSSREVMRCERFEAGKTAGG